MCNGCHGRRGHFFKTGKASQWCHERAVATLLRHRLVEMNEMRFADHAGEAANQALLDFHLNGKQLFTDVTAQRVDVDPHGGAASDTYPNDGRTLRLR